MKNLPNIGLPIILMSILLIVFISISSVNIGYGQLLKDGKVIWQKTVRLSGKML